MRDPRSTGALLAVLVALGVCGCGGSARHDVATRTPDQIVSAATQAIDHVSSVHVSGTVGSGAAHTVTLDLHLVNGKGATGSLSEDGLSFKLISVGGEAYINGTPGFWRRFGGEAAVRRYEGRWLRAPAGSGELASIASLTDVHKLISALLTGHGALTRGGLSTVDGRRVVSVQDQSRHGALYVAATGTPYPILIDNRSGSEGGQLDFGDFDQPVTLTAPVSSVEIAQLRR